MRGWLLSIGLLAWCVQVGLGAELPAPLVKGLKNPESVAVGVDKRIYVTEIGEFNKDGDGRVLVVENGQAKPFTTNLDDPKGIVAWLENLYVADKKRVWKIDKAGKATVLASEKDFPVPPTFLNDVAVDEEGTLYISDSGDFQGQGGAVYRLPVKGKITVVTDTKKQPELKVPNGLVLDSKEHLLVLDLGTGLLWRVKIADGTAEKVAEGLGKGDGLTFDWHGRLFTTDHPGGKVYVIPRAGEKPILLASGFQGAADSCLDPTGKLLLVPDMKAGTLTALPLQVPGQPLDETPLALEPVLAFPKLQWKNWVKEDAKGKPIPHRPLVLTHANDSSNRIFLATQHGVIHVFPNDPQVAQTEIFLDLQAKVLYDDKQNEEGFLGLAFHPDFKKNGEFFVFYTIKDPKLTNILCRYKVSKENPTKADPSSEEELLRVSRPFWNHDGGTICFGPDGFLYVAFGDGGSANDPFENGQNMKSLLGKIIRIDVNRKDEGKKYGIPKDNPFVGQKDVAPEIWASGLRNVWRMSFDRQTGKLWAGEVGQNLWEEINLIVKGGNYGWNRREALHPFGKKGVGPTKEYIEPIWEYHHIVGKSITGGHVYRGKKVPELAGAYLYADYVSNKIWALWYDEKTQRVTANRPIADKGFPVYSFGEDEQGEVYLLTSTASGQGVFRFEKK